MVNEELPEKDPKNQQDLTSQEPMKSDANQNNPPDPGAKDTTLGEDDIIKIPRGPAGDKVRLKIAVNNVRSELSGIKKRIDSFLGLTTNKSDS
jgi:hypothetical protein